MNKNYNQEYLEFASNIHFFEFIQKEFRDPHFKVEKYLIEIKKLSSKNFWTVKELTEFLRDNPKSYEIFEEIFQLARFTNTQLIHFLFDTGILNSTNKEKLADYLTENLINDPLFFTVFVDLFKRNKLGQLELKTKFDNRDSLIAFIGSNKTEESRNFLMTLFKMAVVRYVELAIQRNQVIHDRLVNKNFVDVSARIAEYLINNLNLNETLKGIEVKEFLGAKRIPIDTKSIHGNFGKIKISSILKKHDFVDGNKLFNENNIKTLPYDLGNISELRELKERFIFVTERHIEGINKRKDGRPKLFDFILIYDLKPKTLIETNFYSTAGTKIGINQGEYIDLNEDIRKKFKQFIFAWITDGNYWLSSDGKNRLLNLYSYFGDNILNYNLFDKKLEDIKQSLKI